jgi:hypothetical protein
MAINKNHEFEELDGVKCAIVEKNVSPERVDFLKKLLEYNKFKVVVISSPPPKAASAAIIIEGDAAQPVESPTSPVETFTVGVTDYTFNPVNAIFGRLLHTSEGHIVTLAFWQQKELTSHDDIPYFEIDRG